MFLGENILQEPRGSITVHATGRILGSCVNEMQDFDCSLREVDSQLFESMQNSQRCINCLLPDTRKTLHTLRGEETTHMNSHIIIIIIISVFFCQPVSLQFYFM